jgi:hypothetical protein
MCAGLGALAAAVWVLISTGTSFSTPVQWAAGAFYGNVANHIGDINGGGRADLIAQNSDSVWVKTSTGSSLTAPVRWALGAFLRERRQSRLMR